MGGLRREALKVTSQAAGRCNRKGSSQSLGGAGEKQEEGMKSPRFDSRLNHCNLGKVNLPLGVLTSPSMKRG